MMIAIAYGVDKNIFHGHFTPDDPEASERPTRCHYRFK